MANQRPRTRASSVLVIGAGAAGQRAAIAAHDAGADVLLLAKRPRLDAHTVLASGGINAALGSVDPQDSWEQHFADTMKEGYLLGDPRIVQIMAREAPSAVMELDEWGAGFARTDDGRLDQRYFGAHRYRRTCYAGDYTGRAVLRALAKRAQELGIPVVEDQYVSTLLIANGACFGALAFDLHTGERTAFLANAVVLCTGGHTRLWRRSTSRRDENYGEGMALALEAGCRLRDMEFVQFHPTGIVVPEEVAGTLVTEAVRGEGGRLFNSTGERFMARYDPERLELSTRDRVALANYTEILQGRGGPNGGVFLDITHLGKEQILAKLPRMYRQFIEYQMLDISKEPMEVAPSAHYSMGGIVVDPETNATEVYGLFAAGECAGGLHGANRLGGNSLAETVVFGRRAGAEAAAFAESLEVQIRPHRVIAAADEALDEIIRSGEELARHLQRRIRDLMWERAGVVRDESVLGAGLAGIHEISEAAAEVDVRPSAEGWNDLANALDLRAALVTGEATLRCAIERRETRGAHIRWDYPDLDPTLQVSLHVRRDASTRALVVSREPLPFVPEPLNDLLNDATELSLEARLLE